MRIALLNIFYYPQVVGGAEISTQKLAEELAKSNEVYVVCKGDIISKETINGVHVYRMPLKKPVNRMELYFTRRFRIQCYTQFHSALKEIRPDVLHTNNLNDFTGIVWMIAHQCGIPVVHTLRDYSLLCTYHKHDKMLVKLTSKFVDVITAPSEFTLNYYLENGLFVNTKSKRTIANAIDVDESNLHRLSELKSQNSENQCIRFAYLGRLAPEKGIDWLIRVFSNLNGHVELHIYGHGVLNIDSQKILRDEPAKFIYHGFMEQENLRKELEKIDVIVAPSLWDEPFGRIILDGYASVCPVIITNRGGMPEVVENMRTGIILQDETDASLKEALEYFCERRNIVNMYEDIKRKILHYSVDKQAEAFHSTYLDACSKKA